MALDRQRVIIPLGQGLATDVDPKLLPVGKVTQMENLLWTPQAGDGTATKRPGYTAMPNNYITSGTPAALPVPWQFAQHKGQTLALGVAGPRPIAQFSPGPAKWLVPPVASADGANGITCKMRGQVIATRTTVERSDTTTGFVASNSQVNIASDGTLALEAWIHVVGTIQTVVARFIELATKKVLFSYTLATSGGVLADTSCVYTNGIFTALWFDNGTSSIKEVHWTASAVLAGTAAASSVTTIATGVIGVSASNIDAVAQGNNVAVLYGATAAPNGKTMQTVYAAGSPGSVTTNEILDGSLARIPAGRLGWVSDLGGRGFHDFVTANVNGLWYYLGVNGSGATMGQYNVDSVTSVFAIAAHTTSSNVNGEFAIVYQTATQPAPTKLATRTNAHGINVFTWLNSTSLLSKTFAHNGDFYCLIAYESQTQGTNFVIRVPANATDPVDYTQAPSARYCSAKASVADGQLTNVVSLSSSVLIAGTCVRTRFLSVAGGTLFDIGVDLLTLTFDPVSGTSREYADSTYVCGGLMGAFDGQTFAEEGFHVFPETPVVTQTAGGSMTALGSYLGCTVFKYTDTNGRVHRSSPSVQFAVTLTGGNQSISLVQKTLKLTGRPGQVAIEYYRASVVGATVTNLSLVSVKANDETADTVTFTDSASDASLANAQNLYTTGDVLPSGPPPSPIALAIVGQRLAAVPADDPTLIQISLPLTDFDGEGWPIFDLAQVSSLRIEDVYGDIVGIAGMDDKAIVFKANAIYAFSGSGPDVTGNGTWGTPAFLSINDGCLQPRSILETPDGVIFRANSDRSGYYMVNRGLSLEYIGAPAQAYLNDTIVDAVYITSKDRAMFFTAQGRTHVYDQALSQKTGQPMWTTFTNQAAAAAGLYNGLPVYQQAGQTAFSVLREDSSGSLWDENGTPNNEYVVTPWLSLSGLKGYERFYQLQGIGQAIGAHLVTVTMWTDFNDTSPLHTQTIQIGGPGPTADWNNWRFKFPSKSTAVRFGIKCSRTPGDLSDNAAANISGIVIEYGVKQGMKKIPAVNTAT